MLLELLTTLVALFTPTHEAQALASTDPQDLTLESARDHLAAARVAAAITATDPDVLLAIAWHESRYTIAFTPEPGNRVSCGVMTPVPMATCHSHSLVDGYLAGARHLSDDWLPACHGHLRCALTGYAGGFGLIRHCREDGSRYVRPGVDACKTPEVFIWRARMIRLARSRVSHRLVTT